jgi:hypothetical protein
MTQKWVDFDKLKHPGKIRTLHYREEKKRSGLNMSKLPHKPHEAYEADNLRVGGLSTIRVAR